MASKFLAQLPAPKNQSLYDASSDSWFARRDGVLGGKEDAGARGFAARKPPPYGKRSGFIPRKAEDFGDGGAFPEIHVAQYPLEMGRKDEKVSGGGGGGVLSVTVDGQGRVAYDAIVKQAQNASKTVYSQHKELVPKLHEISAADLEEPDEEEIEATAHRTQAALDKIVSERISAAQPKTIAETSRAPTYIKYTPTQQSAEYNSGAKERVIRMMEMPQDPLDPPKFKHKRVPKTSGSPPVPVMHSPPRPVTVKDQADWKIPPCISNWKNPKGYTIPLDKRLAADGRGLQEVQINDNFARLSEALYVAENKAREEVEMRSKIQKERMLLEKEKKEQELRLLAQKARMERAGGSAPGREVLPPGEGGGAPSAAGVASALDGGEEFRAGESREEREERMKRETLREERRRERERERRLEAKEGAGPPGKKSKITRDRDRDISEKIALGLANAGAGTGEIAYDQRLFNQEQGMASGFGAEDTYNVYDKGLFNREGAGGLYKVRKGMEEEMLGGGGEGEAGELDRLLRTERFKPDKGFAGAGDGTGVPRDGPVEFEKDAVEADPFGLDQFLSTVKGAKKPLDKIGASGSMRASGGSGPKDSYEGGSSRSRIDFGRGGN